MNKTIQKIISFILPITVLILVPLYIERDISIKLVTALVIGVIIMVIGLYIITVTVSSIIRIGKGTLAPWSPSRRLVISGIYGYVRNPMILGVLTVLTGESIAIVSYKILIWAVCFFVTNTIFFLIYEEPNLEKKFGDEYREYKRNVHRWIPRSRPFKPDSEKET